MVWFPHLIAKLHVESVLVTIKTCLKKGCYFINGVVTKKKALLRTEPTRDHKRTNDMKKEDLVQLVRLSYSDMEVLDSISLVELFVSLLFSPLLPFLGLCATFVYKKRTNDTYYLEIINNFSALFYFIFSLIS